jgi:uncharacterized protein (TIGR04255 family)
MPFPPAERVVFDHNPLDLVVTQLAFPSILQIAAEEPAAFQDHIRAEYPLYTREDALAVPAELEPVFAKLGRPPGSVRHSFRTADQRQGAYLTRDFVAYEDRNYERWERFEREVERIHRTLVEVYNPAFFTRIGLRYVNVIKRSALDLAPDTPWKELVKPAFIGLLGLDEYRDRVKDSASVSTVRLDNVSGASVRIQHGLRPLGPEPNSELTYFIDADFFTEEHTNVADVLDRLRAFHAHSGNLFRWVITDTLYQALRPQRVDTSANPRTIGRAAGA